MADNAPEHHETSRAAQLLRFGELSVSSERRGDAHTIYVMGELDLATAGELQQELERVEATDASRSSSTSPA